MGEMKRGQVVVRTRLGHECAQREGEMHEVTEAPPALYWRWPK